MASVTMHRWSTVILANNIHCASCVSYIHDTLAKFRPALKKVDVNILSQQICLVHDPSLLIQEVCAVLNDAAFEIYSATVVDGFGTRHRELEFMKSEDEWFRPASTHFGSSSSKVVAEPPSHHLPNQRYGRRHLDNCDACKKENGDILEAKTQAPAGQVDSLELGEAKPMAHSRLPFGDNDKKSINSDISLGSQLGPEQVSDPDTPVFQHSYYQASLSIGGMTCASCTSAIDHGLSGLDFVASINVSLMTNSATVVFSELENLQAIVEAVEDLGYDCSVDKCEPLDAIASSEKPSGDNRRPLMLRVDGMFCRHCPSRVEEALESRFSAEVTVDKTATPNDPIVGISYVPRPPDFTIRDVVNTIDGTHGDFRTTIYNPPSMEEKSQNLQKHEQRKILGRLLLSVIVAIPTFLIGVVWMSLVPSSNSTRTFFAEPVWSGAVSRSDWALFILATPVMFFAADLFHTRALKEIKALWRRSSRVPIMRRFYRFGSMNLLISAGTSVAYFSSIAILIINALADPKSSGQGSTYFDSVVFLTFFILIGRWLEAYSKAKTGNAVAMLGNLRPQEATLVISSKEPVANSVDSGSEVVAPHLLTNQNTQIIDAKLLEIGDVVLIPHGSSPPADGIIVAGSTKFNESSLTGEAKAVTKTENDSVFSGTVNIGGPIHVSITEVGGTSMLDQILRVVREGQTKRAPVERIVDIVTGYFVPVITALAITTWIIWFSLGQSGALSTKYLGSSKGGWAFWSLEFAIAVFVVACPCGIGLAAPTALFVGSGLAAKHGILVRGGGEAFQEACNIDAVVFDKTGTLTEGGDLRVTDHEVFVDNGQAQIAWRMTKALEESSTHPLARAILQMASTQVSEQTITTTSITEQPGKGLLGTFTTSTTTYTAALGSEALLASLTPSLDLDYFATTTLSAWKSQAKSIALLALRQHDPESETTTPWTPAAAFATSDPIRTSTLPTLTALQSRGIPVYMLTGDNPTTARAVATTLRIPLDHVFAGVLPTEKADKIRWLQEHAPRRSSSRRPWRSCLYSRKNQGNTAEAGKTDKKAIVAFIGDGINDAPALSTANISISLASGTDIAMHASSFILLTSSLLSLITLLDLSARVFRRVKFNFLWAGVYNALLVPVAAGVLWNVGNGGSGGWRLGPVWGSAAMAASSVCVVVSSLALRWEGGWWGWKRG